jgi:hypothetical protein
MMTVSNRIIVHLMPEESAALSAMVAQDTRTPHDQLRYLLVSEAKRRGLLTNPPDPPTKSEGHANVSEAAGVPFGVQS